MHEADRNSRSEVQVDAARRLLRSARPEASVASAAEWADAAARVHATLVERLARLIGDAGVRALFARSVKLTAAELPCFEGLLRAASDKAPVLAAEGLRDSLGTLETAAAFEAAATLYATLLELLSTFIGERLVAKIVLEILPTAPARGTTPPKETDL